MNGNANGWMFPGIIDLLGSVGLWAIVQRRGKDTPVKTLMEMFLSLIVWHVILLMTLVAALYRVLKDSLFRTLNLMRTGGRTGVCAERTSAHPGVVLHYGGRCRAAGRLFIHYVVMRRLFWLKWRSLHKGQLRHNRNEKIMKKRPSSGPRYRSERLS